MVFNRLSNFRYFSADTDPIFRYWTLAHSVKYAISVFLKRRLAQRCCNFCRSCCLLCLNFSFERCAYLSTYRSDAAPVNSRSYCHLYLQISRAPVLWRHRCVIGKENDRNTNYRYSWNVPILADTDYRSIYRCNSSMYTYNGPRSDVWQSVSCDNKVADTWKVANNGQL